jgi:hypothetical protein
VSKNYEIECAIAELEKELVDLKMKKSASANLTESQNEDQSSENQQANEEQAN